MYDLPFFEYYERGQFSMAMLNSCQSTNLLIPFSEICYGFGEAAEMRTRLCEEPTCIFAHPWNTFRHFGLFGQTLYDLYKHEHKD